MEVHGCCMGEMGGNTSVVAALCSVMVKKLGMVVEVVMHVAIGGHQRVGRA